jgi:hypothetical protein
VARVLKEPPLRAVSSVSADSLARSGVAEIYLLSVPDGVSREATMNPSYSRICRGRCLRQIQRERELERDRERRGEERRVKERERERERES